MLMYFDEILGQLADYVDQSPQLRGNTYILIAGELIKPAAVAAGCC